MKKIIATLSLLTLSLSAQASFINGQGSPSDDIALTGGTVLDFESTGVSNTASLYLSGVQITSNGQVEVDSDYSGSYNTRGNFHITNHGNAPTAWTFDFDSSVSAFGFLFGASDVNWMVEAYAGATMLQQYIISPTRGSNAGDYFGISGSGITQARLFSQGGQSDYVFVDDFTFTAPSEVPVPAAVWLFGTGLAGLVGVSRKKKQTLSA